MAGASVKTAVVHCKREPYDVYIGRPSKWGNPYQIGPDGTREEVIAKYENWLWSSLLWQPGAVAELKAMHGKRLGCWCAPLPCHGDVLAAFADDLAGDVEESE